MRRVLGVPWPLRMRFAARTAALEHRLAVAVRSIEPHPWQRAAMRRGAGGGPSPGTHPPRPRASLSVCQWSASFLQWGQSGDH